MSYPCARLACLGCSRVPRHVRGQPRLRDTWPEPLRGQGRLPAVPKPGCGRKCGLLVFSVKDGGRGPWEERFGSFAKKKRATAPAIPPQPLPLLLPLGSLGFAAAVVFHMRLDKRAFLCFDSLNTSFLLSHMAQCLCLAVRLSRLGEEIGRHAVPWPHFGGLLWLASRVRQSANNRRSGRLDTCPPVGTVEGDCGKRFPPLPSVRCPG